MIGELNGRLEAKEISVRLTDGAVENIAACGYDPVYGARPLKRYIQKSVETLCAKLILEGGVGPGDTILIDVKDKELFAVRQTD